VSARGPKAFWESPAKHPATAYFKTRLIRPFNHLGQHFLAYAYVRTFVYDPSQGGKMSSSSNCAAPKGQSSQSEDLEATLEFSKFTPSVLLR